MRPITPRAISTDEAAVVRQALLRAAIGSISPGLHDSVDSLRVVAECECGCRSVYFRTLSAHDYRLADGVGYLSDGTRINVLVWAQDDNISSLEIVDYAGAGQLPRTETVCSWEEAGARAS